MVSSSLTIGSNTALRGAGKFLTKIRPTQAFIDTVVANQGGTLIYNKNASSTVAAYSSNRDISIDGIGFIHKGVAPTQLGAFNCIAFSNSSNISVKNCRFDNWPQHSVDCSGNFNVLLENLTSVNGWWASLQVDVGGGFVGAVGGTSALSNYVTIRDCWCSGGREAAGAIEIHKGGGNNILIENCYIEGSNYGIVADDYFTNTYSIGDNSNIKIVNCYVNVTQDAIHMGKTIRGLVIDSCNLTSQSGYALFVSGGNAVTAEMWSPAATISNNVLKGKVKLRGVERSLFGGNVISGNTVASEFTTRETTIKDNTIYGYGLLIREESVTDPRNSSVYTYTLGNNNVDNNKCIGGSGTSFKVDSTAFNLILFSNNIYFATNNAFDFTGSSVTTGFVISDTFRQSVRPSTPTTLQSSQIGTQAFDSVTKRPVWYNGTRWVFADGTIAY